MLYETMESHRCIVALEENSREVYLEATTLLLRLIDNVLKNPSNPKFRSIRLSNPTIANKLLVSIGAMECLFAMGFIEGEDCLLLPENSSLNKLECIRDEILVRRNILVTATSKSSSKSFAPIIQTAEPSTSKSVIEKPLYSSNSFLQRVESTFHNVLQYEDKTIQKKALELLPMVELQIAAINNLRKLQLEIKKGNKEAEVDMQDLILIELLNWFKSSFFKWVDKPECIKCNGPTIFSNNELVDSIRVEVYECESSCKGCTYFPRYNEASKLLRTRRGRCGEWANCFTLFCRALGWDARLVHDNSDHVWVEVFSWTQERWLHCDPCENVCDSPLMYEHGWGKKISYVIAYSCEEIQDVTWRYTSKEAKEILQVRRECSETELLATILRTRRTCQSKLSIVRQSYLAKRLLSELVEFLTIKQPTSSDHSGRNSGSLAWRLARGETGNTTMVEYVWIPTTDEIQRGIARITYSTTKDEYSDGSGHRRLTGWQNGVYEARDVFRKEENDWKKVYLARKVSSETSIIKWKFDLQGLVIDKLSVKCQSQVYETGKVKWTLLMNDVHLPINDDRAVLEAEALCGVTSLILSAELNGGKGDNAWQHTQLFRQDAGEDSFPLDVQITFHQL